MSDKDSAPVQFRFELADPYQEALAAAYTSLPKNARNVLLVKMSRDWFGKDADVPNLIRAMRASLYGGPTKDDDDLEEKQKRRDRESKPLGAPTHSQPLSQPPQSEPLQRPHPASDPLERQPRRGSVDLATQDALEIKPCASPTIPPMDVNRRQS